MSKKPLPDPEKFRKYQELPDGSGFKIPNSNFIYHFDEFGGWFDENHFYYDSNGNYKPEGPNVYSDEDICGHRDEDWEDDVENDEDDSNAYDDDDGDFHDPYQEEIFKEFERNEMVSSLRKHLERRAKPDAIIVLDFLVLGLQANENDIKTFFKEQNIGKEILNVAFNKSGRCSGTFEIKGIDAALNCFRTSGKALKTGKIYLSVEQFYFEDEKNVWFNQENSYDKKVAPSNNNPQAKSNDPSLFVVAFANFSFQSNQNELESFLKTKNIQYKELKLNYISKNKHNGTGEIHFSEKKFFDQCLNLSKSQIGGRPIDFKSNSSYKSTNQNNTHINTEPVIKSTSTVPKKNDPLPSSEPNVSTPQQNNKSQPQESSTKSEPKETAAKTNQTLKKNEVPQTNSNPYPKANEHIKTPVEPKNEIPKQASKPVKPTDVKEIEKEAEAELKAKPASNPKEEVINANELGEWNFAIKKKSVPKKK